MTLIILSFYFVYSFDVFVYWFELGYILILCFGGWIMKKRGWRSRSKYHLLWVKQRKGVIYLVEDGFGTRLLDHCTRNQIVRTYNHNWLAKNMGGPTKITNIGGGSHMVVIFLSKCLFMCFIIFIASYSNL
jgi:hypothetical protein